MVDPVAKTQPSQAVLAQLKQQAPVILPSLLLCDFGRLADEIAQLEAAGTKALHLDVMDGHFVPNMTYGLTIVEAVRRATTLPIDAHLMISNPQAYIQQYRDCGADIITIHAEATSEPAALLQRIRASGAQAGLAINPPTPVESIEHCLDDCDMVLVMSVMPGFGGQKFDPTALDKLTYLRRVARPELALEVDGGINESTIRQCREAGAELFVVGSAIFGHSDYGQRIELLRRQAS